MIDLLNSHCACGLGTYRRTLTSTLQRDAPGILRCTFCRIPVSRYSHPALERLQFLKRVKKFSKESHNG